MKAAEIKTTDIELTAEQRLFLSCLSDFYHGIYTEKPGEELDFDEFFRLTNEHSLDSLIFTQCRKWLGKISSGIKFRSVFSWHVFYSVNREDFLKEIVDRFRKENIPLICFKGSIFRDFYPEPALRTMGDLDIVIRPKDRTAADRILRDDMRLNRMIDDQAVWIYGLEQFQFEIHDHMFYENLANGIDYRSYFDNIWEHCHKAPVFGIEAENLFVPDEEYHFLYLMAHTAKHVVNKGSGFRAYLDMAMMCKSCVDQMDWDFIEQELRKLSLLTFTKKCMGLCERWFGAEMPLHPEKEDEEFFESVTKKTFRDGIFGIENEENIRAGAAKEIKRSGTHYYQGALKRTLKKLFPPYEDMYLVRWYSFLEGRPWLLPVAWVYRWFYCAVKKSKHSIALLTEPFIKKREVVEREDYLEQWGL